MFWSLILPFVCPGPVLTSWRNYSCILRNHTVVFCAIIIGAARHWRCQQKECKEKVKLCTYKYTKCSSYLSKMRRTTTHKCEKNRALRNVYDCSFICWKLFTFENLGLYPRRWKGISRFKTVRKFRGYRQFFFLRPYLQIQRHNIQIRFFFLVICTIYLFYSSRNDTYQTANTNIV